MAYQVSPGVNVTEIDLTTSVPGVATATGAVAGIFNWGPVGERTLIRDENALASTFGKPTTSNYETFFTAANFLSYGSSLYVVRAANTTTADAANSALNAVANTGAVVILNEVVRNRNDYLNKDGTFDTDGLYIAKYPGALGNSLKISVCDSVNAFSSKIALNGATTANGIVGTFQIPIGSNTGTFTFYSSGVVGAANTFATTVAARFAVGDLLQVGNSSIGTQNLKITSVGVPAVNGSVSSGFTVGFDSKYRLAADYVANTTVNAAPPTATFTGAITLANLTISSAVTGSFTVGQVLTGAGVPANTVILGNTSPTVWQLSTSIATPLTATNMFVSSTEASRSWEYSDLVDTAPATSYYVANFGNTAAVDTMHVVVSDQDGKFTGVPGSVLEVFSNVSRATDAKTQEGGSLYYKNVINDGSAYVWFANDRAGAVSNTAANIASSSNIAALSLSFAGGTDGFTESTAPLNTLAAAYDLFKSSEEVDISLIMQGKPRGGSTVVGGQSVSNFQLANYIIDNITESRKDCVAFISPDDALIKATPGTESTSIVNWFGAVNDSTYAVFDSGYKYMYDRYNDVYRYVPLNGDIAGLTARTEFTNDAWWSPAGFNRGQIKNLIKLRYNPTKPDRDLLYKNAINPVVTFPGQGTVLFGDKTGTKKPSAFDRINVRRLFITLERAIAQASRFSLFEFNDEFTRSQFKNLVVPYLRDVQARRGVQDFLVVCDATNNTAERIDRNEFWGDIYIKPNRSINFIQLNFVAVRTGVQFSTVIGQF